VRPSRLLLIRWCGDVIGTQTLGKGQDPDVSGLPDDASVTFEVVELSARASFRGPVDLRPALLVLGSVVFHAGVALLLLTASRKSPHEIESDRLDVLRAYSARLAVSEHQTPEVHIEELASVTPPQQTDNPPDVVATAPAHVTPPSSVAKRADASPVSVAKRGDGSLASAPSVCAPPVAHASTGPMCTRAVVVRSLTLSSPTCYTDLRVAVGDRGTLSYPCSGDGASKLSFDRGTFEGAEIGGKVTVCTGTQYEVPSVDTCTWSTAQEVTGSIASGTLRFTYGETPKEPPSMCASACTSAGSIEVE
jgi:hypothetical protein